MTTLTAAPSTLTRTLEQVRDLEVAYIGTQAPTRTVAPAWWPLADPTTNDCLGFQLFSLGVRRRDELAPHYISIAAFRAWAGWEEIPAGELRAGDLPCWNFSGGRLPEHIEFGYAIDHAAGQITTVSANTGPEPGLPAPRGVWKKTRPITGALLFGIRPPYRPLAATITPSRRAQVRTIATYLNRTLPVGYADTAAGDITHDGRTTAGDGIPGPIYWHNVQAWGRIHGLYGATFKIDGIPGPRTRYVEAAIWAKAKQAR